MNNKNIFSSKEFDNWLDRDGLQPEEKKLIVDYLEKDKSTLEAGTASGRILFEMNKLGFTNLSGFDFIPEYISAAKKRNNNSIINFSVQDATKLDFGNELFGQIIYLQQIISTIEEPGMRLSALEESYRVLEKGGTAIFSFLSFESKKNDSVFKIISPVIKFFRFIKSKKISEQYIPWLKFSGKVNFKALFDIGPYNYWFRRQEIIELLESVGYKIEFYGYPKKILFNNSSTKSAFGKSTEEVGHFYVVCKKVL